MIRFKAVVLNVCFGFVLSSNFVAQASETQSLEQAFVKCKIKYPSEFEAKNVWRVSIALMPPRHK